MKEKFLALVASLKDKAQYAAKAAIAAAVTAATPIIMGLIDAFVVEVSQYLTDALTTIVATAAVYKVRNDYTKAPTT